MLKILLAGGLIAGLLGTTAVDPTPTDRITIDSFSFNGTGCPRAGSAEVAPDNTNVTFTFDSFTAQVGVGSSPLDMRKNCQISMVVHVGVGQTYALGEMEHRGFALLAPGATALVRETTYFQGQTPPPFIVHTWTGPLADDIEAVDVSDLASLVFSPCGSLRNLNINFEVRVNAGTSDTRSTTSSLTLEQTLTAPLIVRPCR